MNTPKNKVINYTTVVVSGGFDPVHIGHIHLFKEAKKTADKLIVILNNDNWLKAKKCHIFMKCKERKEILKALKFVDEVVVTRHEKDSTDRSINAELVRIRPDFFANGGDRKRKNIPEVQTCNDIGCKMIFNVGDKEKMQSSSKLLEDYVKRVSRG